MSETKHNFQNLSVNPDVTAVVWNTNWHFEQRLEPLSLINI
jgi:hypothetical protein